MVLGLAEKEMSVNIFDAYRTPGTGETLVLLVAARHAEDNGDDRHAVVTVVPMGGRDSKGAT